MNTVPDNLDKIYQEACVALKAKNFDLASELLRQILVIDENYKDVSRLLATLVQRERRRWYNDPRLYAAVVIAAVILLVIWLAPRVQTIFAAQAPASTIANPSSVIPSTTTAGMTSTPTIPPTSTPIRLAWKRISMLQGLPRDTVTAMISDPKDPDVLYAGMQWAGIYKTINEGMSWSPLPNQLGITGVNNFAIDRENSQILYTATNLGIYQTQDGGNTWKYLHNGFRIYIDPKDNSRLFTHTSDTLYETNDRGNNWQNLSLPVAQNINAFAISPNNSETLYIDQGKGIYKSTDGGSTWSAISSKLGLNSVGSDQANKDVVFVNNLYSNDAGINWRQIPIICTLGIDAGDPGTVACTGSDRLYLTRNGGTSWNKFQIKDFPFWGATIFLDHISEQLRIFLLGNDILLSRNNGNSWESRINGLGFLHITLKLDTGIPPSFFLTYGNVDGCNIIRSDDQGNNWSVLIRKNYTVSLCEPNFDNKNNLFIALADGIQESSDNGRTWNRIIQISPARNPKGDYVDWMADMNGRTMFKAYSPFSVGINPYASAPIFLMTRGNVYSSIDQGVNWKMIPNIHVNWDPQNIFNNNINGEFYFGKNNQRHYFIGNGQMSFSSDYDNWTICSGAPSISSPTASSLSIAFSDDRHIFLVTDNSGVFESMDGCESWQKKSNGIPNVSINTIAINPNNDKTMYAATTSGAYVSFNGGESWHQINDGLLGATIVYSIVIDRQSNVYAATPYGIFQLEAR
jgi:photosystem II stability/assembly factor-like uncharacterized protein